MVANALSQKSSDFSATLLTTQKEIINDLERMGIEIVMCDAPFWLIVWCVWMCDKSHIGYLLGRSELY